MSRTLRSLQGNLTVLPMNLCSRVEFTRGVISRSRAPVDMVVQMEEAKLLESLQGRREALQVTRIVRDTWLGLY